MEDDEPGTAEGTVRPPSKSAFSDQMVREFLRFAGYRVGVDADQERFALLMRWSEARKGVVDKRTGRRQVVVAAVTASLMGGAITALAGHLFAGGWPWLSRFL